MTINGRWSQPGAYGADTILSFATGTAHASSITIQNYHVPTWMIDQSYFYDLWWDAAGDISHLTQIVGTGGTDNLAGSAADELLIGGDGSDNLQASLGNDILDPGAGGAAVQNLYGQGGDDTYRIGADSGQVRISTWAENANTGFDRVVFSDLTMDDVSITHYDYGDADGMRLIIAWNKYGQSGAVHIAHTGAHIEEIEFSDGMVMQSDWLVPGLLEIVGTDGDDVLAGSVFDEHLIGGDGTDLLRGSSGNDVLDPGAGGAGYQHLFGQHGDDTYLIGHDVGTARISVYAENADTGLADTVQFTDLLRTDVTVNVHHGWGADGSELRMIWDVAGQTGALQVGQMGGFIEAYIFADGETVTADDLILG